VNQFSDRLKIVISNESVNSFAKKCAVPEATLRTYLSGASLPGMDKLVAISDAAQVNIKWLATGNGPKDQDKTEFIDAEVHKFTMPFLTIITEDLEEHEKEKSGGKLTPTERLDIIRTSCDMLIDSDVVSDQDKDKIVDIINMIYNFLPSLDLMIRSEKRRERARYILKNKLDKIWSKKDIEREVEFFIDSRIEKYNQERIMKDNLKNGDK